MKKILKISITKTICKSYLNKKICISLAEFEVLKKMKEECGKLK